MFETRWRWNAMRSLALLRSRGGKRVPPALQRMRAQDLIAAVFPGPDRLPGQPRRRRRSRSPTTRWCARPCATAWSRRWTPRACARCSRRCATGASPRRARAPGAVGVRARDPERQPVRVPRRRAAGGAAHARGRAAPRAARRPSSSASAGSIRRRSTRWSPRRSPIRATPTSCTICCSTSARCPRRSGARAAGPICSTRWSPTGARRAWTGEPLHWVAAERRSLAAAVWPERRFVPDVVEPPSRRAAPRRRRERAGRDRARPPRARWGRRRRRRSRRAWACGRPTSTPRSRASRWRAACCAAASSPTRADEATQWCDRRLLARINRRMLDGLRREIEPVSAADCLRFLFGWQHVRPGQPAARPPGLARVIAELQGFEAAAGAWERAHPAGARGRLRPGVARRALPLGRRQLGTARRARPRAARPAARRRSRSCAAPTCPGCWRPTPDARRRRGAVAAPRATCSRFLGARRRQLPRRDHRRRAPPARRGRGRAGRAGVRRARDRRRLLGPARADLGDADARRRARALARPLDPAHRRGRGRRRAAGRCSAPGRARGRRRPTTARSGAWPTRPATRRWRASTSNATASCSAICWRARRRRRRGAISCASTAASR